MLNEGRINYVHATLSSLERKIKMYGQNLCGTSINGRGTLNGAIFTRAIDIQAVTVYMAFQRLSIVIIIRQSELLESILDTKSI